MISVTQEAVHSTSNCIIVHLHHVLHYHSVLVHKNVYTWLNYNTLWLSVGVVECVSDLSRKNDHIVKVAALL